MNNRTKNNIVSVNLKNVIIQFKPFSLEKQFNNLIKNIEPRGGSFYRFGFKTYQKTNKKLFAEVLNVPSNKMHGTIHIGQLWSNYETAKYMKQNKIFINKLKLMDKLKYAKQQQDRQLLDSSTTIPLNSDSRNSLGSKYCISKRNTVPRFSNNQITNQTFRQLNLTMDQINKKIKKLGPALTSQKNIEQLNRMQKCVQKIVQIDNEFYEQMSEWI